MSSAEGRSVDQADTPNGRSCHQRNGAVDNPRLPADPKLTLHPASFDDDAHPEEDLDAAASGTGPSLSQTTQRRAGKRRTTLRDVLDDGTNPFLPDRREARPPGLPAFRQELYPGYDGTGRRIGLEHLRGSGAPPRHIGHYRQHVHEYDAGRGHQHPVPPYHQSAPSFHPASIGQHPDMARIAPTPGAGSVFPGMQAPRKTPHEILGLPPNAPLDLSSLLDPPPGEKPQYHYHVLMKLAILGTSSQRATLQEILAAIRGRFSYYQMLGKKESTAFGNSVRHSLSLLSAFIRVPKPATEPGKGAYWTVDFSKGEGNKRERKRNTKNKTKTNKNKDSAISNPFNGQQPGPSESDADDSDDNPENGSAFAQGPIFPPPSQVQARYERMPANRARFSRKAVASTGDPRNEVQQHGGSDFYNCIDPMLMGESVASDRNYAQPSPETHMHSRSSQSGVGAHRGRMSRGVARSSPYPTPLIMPNDVNSVGTGSGPESGSSGEARQFPSRSPVDGSEYHTSVSPQSVGTPPLPYQPVAFGTPEHFQDSRSNHTAEYIYASHFRHPQSSHYSSESPQGSPLVDPPGLPNFAGGEGRTFLPPSQLAHQFQPELPGSPQASATGSSLSPSSTYFSQGPTFGASSFNSGSGSGPGGPVVNGSFSRLSPTGFLSQESFPFSDASNPTDAVSSSRPNERRNDSLYARGSAPPAARRVPSRASPRNRDAHH
ncbi:hypothetical protein M0805_002358 [Coniferiporia weirii]|nr:hypothetical protein M0805_002358 [Coniferiporia weirii]